LEGDMSQVASYKVSKAASNEDEQLQNQVIAYALVNDKLNNFYVIRNPFLRIIIFVLPILLGFMLLADLLIGKNMIVRDLFRLTGIISAIVELIVIKVLFSKVLEVLISIWSQNLVTIPNNPNSTQMEFLEFIHDFESGLNNHFSILTG